MLDNRNHPIPSAALSQHIAILGKTGSGKTYAAKGVVEGLLARKVRVTIVDPTGVYWGLRLDPGGKKASPFKIVIFGGRHGDLPLGPQDGARLAEIAGSSATPVILDTQLMSVNHRTQFFTAFAEGLLRSNSGPHHLILDEAHLFAPQSGGAGQNWDTAQMLHATNNLVSLGRSAGLRITLISQRPSKLHKDALTQVETLVAMRLIAPQDRKAVKDWLDGAPDRSRAAEIMSALASLPQGTGFIFAPEQGVLVKSAFPPIATYDSGKPLETRDMPALKPLNIAAIKAAMARNSASDEGEKRDKPGAGRAARPDPQSAAGGQPDDALRRTDEAAIKAAERRGYAEGFAAGARQGWLKAIDAAREAVSGAIQALPLSLDASTATAIGRRAAADDGIQSVAAPASRESAAQAPNMLPACKGVSKVHDGVAQALTGPQRELLRALAWWHAMGHQAPARTQIAAIAGWKPKGSNLRNRLSELSAAGLVIYPSTGLVSLTNAGIKAAPAPDPSQTLIESVRAVLTGPQLALFDELVRARHAMRRADLAIAVGWEASGSNLRNRLSELAALDLVEYPAAGVVALRDWVSAA